MRSRRAARPAPRKSARADTTDRLKFRIFENGELKAAVRRERDWRRWVSGSNMAMATVDAPISQITVKRGNRIVYRQNRDYDG